MAKFFYYPFAINGDKTPIPNPGQPATVSYSNGWGVDYQLNQTDPNYLPIPRNESNQLYFDITDAIRQYQTLSRPDFITTSDNQGTPFSYEAGVQVRYPASGTPQTYLCKNTGAVTLPTIVSDWRLMDLNAAGLILDNVTFSSSVVQSAAVYWNSDANQFQPALANNGPANNVIGIADVNNSRILLSGYVVSDLYTGLTVGATYYLSDATPGHPTTIRPALYVTPLGVAISSTRLMININNTALGASRSARIIGIGNQVLTSGNNIVSSFSSTSFDGYGMTGVQQFVAPWAGRYRVTANACVQTTDVNFEVTLNVVINGAYLNTLGSYKQPTLSGSVIGLSGSDIFQLAAGTVIQLAIRNLRSLSIMLVGQIALGVPQTIFSLEYLGLGA